MRDDGSWHNKISAEALKNKNLLAECPFPPLIALNTI